MTVLLTIILIFYILYLLSPYILAFLGKRLIRRMQKNFEAQAAGRNSGFSSNSKRRQQSHSESSSASPSQHSKIFTADEGQYVDFEEVDTTI